MADLTDSVVQRYVQIPAGQDVDDRFDQDNFYPMDGVIDESDVAFSELFGGRLKKMTKKGGGKGFFKEVGGLLQTKDEAEGVSRLEKRLARRNRRAANRAKRRGMRRTARQERQMARERALNPPIKAEKNNLVAPAAPAIQQPVRNVIAGQGTPADENINNKVNALATNLANDPDTKLDRAVVKEELRKVTNPTEAAVVLDEILDDDNSRGKSGWAGMSMPAKIGIIGGGVAVLGLATFLIVRATKRNKS